MFFLLFSGLALLLTMGWLWNLVSFGVAKVHRRHEFARSAAKNLRWLNGGVVFTGAGLWLWFGLLPTAIYRYEFGENRSGDVRKLLVCFPGGFFGKEVLLRFQAAPSTIRRLAKKQKMRLVPHSQFAFDGATNSPPPLWWEPEYQAHSQLYVYGALDNVFSHDKADLLYDSQSRTAYYSFFSEN